MLKELQQYVLANVNEQGFPRRGFDHGLRLVREKMGNDRGERTLLSMKEHFQGHPIFLVTNDGNAADIAASEGCGVITSAALLQELERAQLLGHLGLPAGLGANGLIYDFQEQERRLSGRPRSSMLMYRLEPAHSPEGPVHLAELLKECRMQLVGEIGSQAAASRSGPLPSASHATRLGRPGPPGPGR